MLGNIIKWHFWASLQSFYETVLGEWCIFLLTCLRVSYLGFILVCKAIWVRLILFSQPKGQIHKKTDNVGRQLICSFLISSSDTFFLVAHPGCPLLSPEPSFPTTPLSEQPPWWVIMMMSFPLCICAAGPVWVGLRRTVNLRAPSWKHYFIDTLFQPSPWKGWMSESRQE